MYGGKHFKNIYRIPLYLGHLLIPQRLPDPCTSCYELWTSYVLSSFLKKNKQSIALVEHIRIAKIILLRTLVSTDHCLGSFIFRLTVLKSISPLTCHVLKNAFGRSRMCIEAIYKKLTVSLVNTTSILR